MSLRFEYPQVLWGLLAVAALLFLMGWRGVRKGGFSPRRAILALIGFSACIIGLSRPQGGHYSTSQRGLRGDIYFAIDISNSMRAEDLSPSRLEFSTAFLRNLLRGLPGLRVGLFPFAADGYLLMPLSADQDAAADLLSSLTPSLTTNQGTDFDASLTSLLTAILKTKQERGYDSAPTRVLLLSDGETHASVPRALLEKFRSRAIPIDTVGVGTLEGSQVPVEGRGGFGRETLRDADGKPVLSRLDPKPLRAIAEGTGGNYYLARFDETPKISARILQGMQLGKLNTRFQMEHEYYPLLFLIALIAFTIEFAFGRWEYFIRGGATTAICLFGFSAFGWDEKTEARLDVAPEKRPYVAYNEGLRLAKEKNDADASELFQESAATAKDPDLRKQALFNLGNALLRMKDPTQALSAYQRSYDTKANSSNTQDRINRSISENMLLAKKIEQQQQEQRKQQGEGEGDSEQPPPDPGKPQQFKSQSFDEAQKKKMFDLVASEEQQVLQRLQQGKQNKKASQAKGKPW